MLQPLAYPLRISPQIEDGSHQNPRRVRLVKYPVGKPLHHLPSDPLEIKRGNMRKTSDPRQIRINRHHEFHPESFAIIFEAVENLLQLGVSPGKELHRQTHRDPRMRALTSSHATTSPGWRR